MSSSADPSVAVTASVPPAALSPFASVPVLVVLAATLSLHLPAIGAYGIFIDELYYLACAERLAWGYVDHPPVIAWVTWFARALAGDWLPGLRLPALAAGLATIAMGALMARELGGGRFAQTLTAALVALAPLLVFHRHVLSMNAFDVLFIAGLFWIVLRIDGLEVSGARRQAVERWWIALGALGGLALLTKLTPAFFGVGFGLAVLVAPQRRWLRRRGPWLAVALSGAIFLPHVMWQIAHGWPTLEFMHNASTIKNRALSPTEFLLGHVSNAGHVAFLVIVVGWIVALAAPRRRFLAVGYLATLVLFAVGGGKPYYLGAALPLVFALGTVAIERWTRRLAWARFLRVALIVLVVAAGLPALPSVLPILPPPVAAQYFEAIGGTPESAENKEVGPLPQHFADMFGHRQLVEDVAAVRDALPLAEQESLAIFGVSYAQAGAIDFYGPGFDLPPAMSGHNTYLLWGPTPKAHEADVWLVLGGSREAVEASFADVELGALSDDPYAMPWRRNLPIWIAREPRRALDDEWRSLKLFE
ncbi:MAG: glycosyltransferase family 39 protein [Acidobacteriota bacterium]